VLSTARRTAALVNVLDAGSAAAGRGPAPDAVAEVLRAYGESDPVGLTVQDVDGMREAAVLLRDVFAAESADAAAHVLNRLLGTHTGRLRLTSHRGASPWHPHLDHDDDAPWPLWFRASSGRAWPVRVWDRQRPPGRVCASGRCGNVFITRGSGPERRYCSRRCATRERVAAHRRRADG
jgi:predicted RNA-binding Zn ribbon-like protein